MAINRNLKSFTLLGVSLLCLLLSSFFSSNLSKPPIEVSKQDSAINLNSNLYLIFSAGQKRLISDLLWITTLLESDVSHYKQKDLNSWMFLRFKSIIDVDPKFLRAYTFGGKYLSIVKDDLEGAKYIFEKGLENFPNDYTLNFDAAFLYAFELGDYERAGEIYDKVITFDRAPKYIKSLAAKIKYQQHNDLESAFKVIEEMLNNEPSGSFLYQKLQSDIYAIKAELDLNCLNNEEIDKSNCDIRDYKGQPYFFNGIEYSAVEKFKPFTLHSSKEN